MKKLLVGIMVLVMLIPAMVLASPTPEELMKKIDALNAELAKVKSELENVQTKQQETSQTVEKVSQKVGGGLAKTNFSFDGGDFRFRVDSTRAHVPGYYDEMQYMSALQAWQQGGMKGPMPTINQFYQRSYSPKNDDLYTTRLRLDMSAKATENIMFKGRLAMYKIWGMETANATAAPFFASNGYLWDPNISRRPNDNTVRVEMAYVNWTNIGGYPIWFSVGRRPTVDGPPLQLKENLLHRYATPTALGVDWTFDGATVGYAYSNPFPGKIRICYGRGYQTGFQDVPYQQKIDNVDLYGISWDVIDDPDRDMFANLQLFKAGDIPDTMENISTMFSPVNAYNNLVMFGKPSNNLGDIYHLSGVFMHKLPAQFLNIDYFLSAGMSYTDPRGVSREYIGLINPGDPSQGIGGYGLLNNPGEDQKHWGWAAYVGFRVPIEQLRSKLGVEYNYGSRYWINFTPASDDLYLSKLATRGHVGEIYWIWDIPDTPLSKLGRAFIRAGYQYYWINYTGSGNWVGKPIDIDNLKDPQNASYMGQPGVDRMDNAYLTFEVYF
ncbi:DUF3373 family protein [Dissulfurimicrobium hydrothermale]|uniref:DUF3373 family protein n=1 Tax=Dissulfurimicrobium hydrothermale TaxID=1750598 RepID=UPI001EDAC138|nr:DUF3373 family protein [Dissulfurimicrobium hydrothermale]UKL14468.1 DUF3373 domain-containing protein [Dissulfurimicrobium hydrothermale]